jgi:hypothetical protein
LAQHVFYRDQQGNIRHIWRFQEGDFKDDNWTYETGAPRAAGDPAVYGQAVFYRDEEGRIQHIRWSQQDGFHHDAQWNAPARAVSDPAVMLSKDGGLKWPVATAPDPHDHGRRGAARDGDWRRGATGSRTGATAAGGGVAPVLASPARTPAGRADRLTHWRPERGSLRLA